MPPKKVKTREPRVYYYVRCSTDKQDIKSQQVGVETWLAEKKLVITHRIEDEAVSGTVPWQERKISTIVNDSLAGDHLVVAELSRLGRVSSEILTIVDMLTKKGVTILSHKGNWTLDSSIQGKILVMVMALMSELERSLISAYWMGTANRNMWLVR